MDGNGRGENCFSEIVEMVEWSWKFAYGGQVMVDCEMLVCWSWLEMEVLIRVS